MRYIVIDPVSSNLPYGPFNSEKDANNFIADRNLTSAGVSPESDLDPDLRVGESLVRCEDGEWRRW